MGERKRLAQERSASVQGQPETEDAFMGRSAALANERIRSIFAAPRMHVGVAKLHGSVLEGVGNAQLPLEQLFVSAGIANL